MSRRYRQYFLVRELENFQLFSNEIIPMFSSKYEIRKDNLPTVQELRNFLASIAEPDKIEITFDAEDHFCSVENARGLDKYNDFVQAVYDDDAIKVSICITKKISDGELSVYNHESFFKFLACLKMQDIFLNFTDLFKKCGDHIVFKLVDNEGTLRTRSIAFSDNNVIWKENEDREKLLKKCEDACVFFDRERINLVPQDFEVETIDGEGFDSIAELFKKLESILSYIYVANTASIVNEVAVLQFDPSSNSHQFLLDQLSKISYLLTKPS